MGGGIASSCRLTNTSKGRTFIVLSLSCRGASPGADASARDLFHGIKQVTPRKESSGAASSNPCPDDLCVGGRLLQAAEEVDKVHNQIGRGFVEARCRLRDIARLGHHRSCRPPI